MPIEKLFPNFFRSAAEKNSHETDFFPETPWPEDKEPLEEEEEEDSAEVFPHQVIFLLDTIIEELVPARLLQVTGNKLPIASKVSKIILCKLS